MPNLDVLYIKGNPSSGTPLQHEQINKSVIELINKHTYQVIDSQEKNLSGVQIPKAKVYIGFSRGSRYLKKLDSSSLKISIGGISGNNVHLFINSDDKILLGDISALSLEGHFIICDNDKIKIKSLIDNFLSK